MSFPPTNQGGQSQPVVQTIFESFTRCFNPVEGHSACTKLTKKDRGDMAARSRKVGAYPIASKSSHLFGINIGSASNCGGGSNCGGDAKSSLPVRAVSRSTSSSDSRKKALALDMSYDADSVAKAKKSAHRRMSAQAVEERSMKRKLEIFRGTSNEGVVTQSRPPPKLAPRHGRQSPQPPSSSRQPSPQNNISSANLALSDDEEELIRLAQSRKRFACGMHMDRIQNNSPISSVARLFNFGFTEAQKPFVLCFATPVRTASQENIANLSDDKLTDDEFLRRHHQGGNHNNNIATVSPGDMDSSSYCEEETISSTLYFDQKYSHVVQTRPPMPLFQEHMLSCTESKNDELFDIIKRHQKRSGSPPVELVTSTNTFQQRSSKRSSSKRSSSPATTGNVKTNNDYPPSPVRIRDESLSTSFTDENGQQQEKETVFSSAFEI